MKLAGKNAFHSVNENADVACGYSGDLPDRLGIHVFEIKKHHLAIHRPQPMNQLQEPVECDVRFDVALMISGIRRGFDFLQSDKFRDSGPALADDMI